MEASARARLGNAVLTVKDGWSVLHPAGSDTSADALFAYCKEHREALRAVFSRTRCLAPVGPEPRVARGAPHL